MEGEREGKKHPLVASCTLTGDLAHNPGVCPDWESNWQPFGLQPVLNLLSCTSQGISCILMMMSIMIKIMMLKHYIC